MLYLSLECSFHLLDLREACAPQEDTLSGTCNGLTRKQSVIRSPRASRPGKRVVHDYFSLSPYKPSCFSKGHTTPTASWSLPSLRHALIQQRILVRSGVPGPDCLVSTSSDTLATLLRQITKKPWHGELAKHYPIRTKVILILENGMFTVTSGEVLSWLHGALAMGGALLSSTAEKPSVPDVPKSKMSPLPTKLRDILK
uniref:Uncharacterized protein n=1 Tax=Molossus molossus TaxID=27622 RepID=A0A7J8HIE1_MOLMO|nr:hypothetical protein HJG59_011063 [Molossus molossus]